jgi:hypothetical protein
VCVERLERVSRLSVELSPAARRQGLVSEDCNEVLRLASVFGRDFEPEALARLAGLELDLLLDLLDQAIAARIVTDQHAGGPFRFAHDLIRDTL